MFFEKLYLDYGLAEKSNTRLQKFAFICEINVLVQLTNYAHDF